MTAEEQKALKEERARRAVKRGQLWSARLPNAYRHMFFVTSEPYQHAYLVDPKTSVRLWVVCTVAWDKAARESSAAFCWWLVSNCELVCDV